MNTEPFDVSSRLDSEHLAALNLLPSSLLDLTDLAESRKRINGRWAAMPKPEIPASVSIVDHLVEGFDGHPLMVRLYKPDTERPSSPGFYWVHGGGLILGDVSNSDPWCAEVACDLDVVVASVEYRLAPEFPYPIPLEDCYAGLTWFFDHATATGMNGSRIAIGGSSAGAGLAAGLAMLARDRGQVQTCFQFLRAPMLDDRNDTRSSYLITDARLWNRAANQAAWNAYLGGKAGASDIPAYAAAARATDLAGLPPAIITVGDLDLFVDEDVAFAEGLLHAGVPTELHVYPGAFHGSIGSVPDSDISRRWKRDEFAALDRALNDGQ
ncbi:MAG: alpha/beta hydrolase [Acidimicrobiia bacterium]|nr:MAG: alpha/beta hydrolase [Acidimicrobiia bacterium]